MQVYGGTRESIKSVIEKAAESCEYDFDIAFYAYKYWEVAEQFYGVLLLIDIYIVYN